MSKDEFQDNQDERMNVGCRIFAEQIEVILNLPENERKEFLWALIINAYSKYKNQNESTLISGSVSALSNFTKLIFNSMQKTVRFKKFSSNYGGFRQGAGRPIKEKPTKTNGPTKKEIEDYCKLVAKKIDVDDFIAYYTAAEWLDKNGLPINWKQKIISWSMKQKDDTPKKKVWTY